MHTAAHLCSAALLAWLALGAPPFMQQPPAKIQWCSASLSTI